LLRGCVPFFQPPCLLFPTKCWQILPQTANSAHLLLDIKRDSSNARSALFLTDILVYTVGCVTIGGYTVLHYGTIEVGMVVFVATVVLLVLGRMMPRALGKRYAARTVPFTTRSLTALLLITKPFVKLTNSFFALASPETKDEEEAVREELDEILETARDEGSLDAGEYRIFKNIMRFSDVQVSDVMTPRTVVFSCPCTLTVKEAIALPELRQYSRFPVYEEDSLDSVIGYALVKDIFWAVINNRTTVTLRDIARTVYFIPENINLDRVLEHFLERREHLFVVVDEYGGVEGLLTMEDVMETLLGAEIIDEVDKVRNLRILAKQRRDQRITTLLEQNAHVDIASATDDKSAQTQPKATQEE
jgi:CBS domain containing-hemolysin-like protein